MKITPVLAENYEVFVRFIKEQNLNIGHFAYISHYEGIKGYRGLIITVSRYWRNPNYNADFFSCLEDMSKIGHVSVIKGLWSTVTID